MKRSEQLTAHHARRQCYPLAGTGVLYRLLINSLMMIAVVLPWPVSAQNDPEIAPRYEVEILVFRYSDQHRNTEESWQPIVPEPDEPEPDHIYGDPIDLMHSNAIDLTSEIPQDYVPIDPLLPVETPEIPAQKTIDYFLLDLKHEAPESVQLPDSALQLQAEFERLQKLDAYQPALHLAWNQSTPAKDQAVPFEIPLTVVKSSGISGSVTLYKDRFVHLSVNLKISENLPEVSEPDIDDWWREPLSLSSDLTGLPDQVREPIIFNLQESRRIRGSQLQYFDHPKFGLIARIKQIETPKPQL